LILNLRHGHIGPPRGSTSKTYDTGSGAIINSSGQQIHDDATPFLLIQNLPYDVKVEEVLVLLKKYSGCDHLTAQDIIIPRDRSKFKNAKQRMVESSHAFVNFQHIKGNPLCVETVSYVVRVDGDSMLKLLYVRCATCKNSFTREKV
jgi:hypothetical protein